MAVLVGRRTGTPCKASVTERRMKDFELETPIERVDGSVSKAVKIRPMLYGDLLDSQDASDKDHQQNAHLTAKCAGMTVEELRRVTLRDFNRLQAAIAELSDSKKGGGTIG